MRIGHALTLSLLVAIVAPLNFAHAQNLFNTFPEQTTIEVRSPTDLQSVRIPRTGIPLTVATDSDNRQQEPISLDKAIQVALQNAKVVRFLGGVSAGSSGRTIYDVAISNTGVDLQTAVFDPTVDISSTMNKTDQPGATFDPLDPTRSIFVGSSTDSVNSSFGLNKRMFNGGTAGVNANVVGSYFEPGVFPLEPEYRSFVELTLRQPMMRGYGRAANLAPVIVARIDTERSYFQFKDSVQELVRGVIAAYWNLVAARIDTWARTQQIEQANFAYQRAKSRKRLGLDRAADVAQASSALANFKASLITSKSNLILAETALRNLLGLPPSNSIEMVPTSKPVFDRVDFDWEQIVSMAEIYRPDIIELKLILEADQQSLLQADNQAKPQLDGIANYRWNGLSGEMPNGDFTVSQSGRFAGYNLGVNFSVPVGLRQGRASLRRQELIIARDQANLDQGIHQMVHQLTINYRNLDQFFAQYLAFKEAREAAYLNYENQAGEVLAGRREFINALQAITDWGNAVSQEASSITQYNIELANVERQTGTILETHGVRFYEERYGSLGPFGPLGLKRTSVCDYPERIDLGADADNYEESENTSDDAFDLQALDFKRESDRQKNRAAPEERKSPPPSQPELEAPKLELKKPSEDESVSTTPSPGQILLNSNNVGGEETIAKRPQRKRLRDIFRR